MFIGLAVLFLFTGCAPHPRSPMATRPDLPSTTSIPSVGIRLLLREAIQRQKTASGETYDMYKMTAAHRTLPMQGEVQWIRSRR